MHLEGIFRPIFKKYPDHLVVVSLGLHPSLPPEDGRIVSPFRAACKPLQGRPFRPRAWW